MAQELATPMASAMARVTSDAVMANMAHSTPLPVVTPSIDLAVGHQHHFVPTPDGHLYGKTRYRNRCACGTAQHPETATMDGRSAPDRRLPVGPQCRRCGFPTVAGLVDPDNPLHPCCAEPQLMALGRAARRRSR